MSCFDGPPQSFELLQFLKLTLLKVTATVLLNMREYSLKLIECAVLNYQSAIAFCTMLKGDAGAELFG